MGGKSKLGGGGTTWSTAGSGGKKKPIKSKNKTNAQKPSTGAEATTGSGCAPTGASSQDQAVSTTLTTTANGNGDRVSTNHNDCSSAAQATAPATAALPATGLELIGKVVVFKHDPLSRGNPRIHPPPKPTLNPRKYLLFDSPPHYANWTLANTLSDDHSVLVITHDLILHLAVGREVSYYVWDDFGGFMQYERKHRIKSIRECVIQNSYLLHVGKRDVETVMSLHDPTHVLTQLAGMVCVPGGTLYEKGRKSRAFAGLVGRVLKLRPEYMVMARSVDNPTERPSLLRDPAKTLLLPRATTYESAVAAARPDDVVVHLTEGYIAPCATLVFASVLDRDMIPLPVVIGSSVQFCIPPPKGSGMDANEHGAVVELDDRQSVLDMVAFAEHLRAKARHTHNHRALDSDGSEADYSDLGLAVPLAAD
ncbi:hypothetical protein BCR44DRAFT_60859 [Catenaria anguillulae PL171]|uniref:Uncharacterized protein n=1 Tax=Catenaria anguillulae PL171 TaxID=765915 RepID=A0A1Y2H9T4_9FUNG|nr:hypothetical protein BCR44DRAFT_60859 [Catenaria anguillulae PL171]